MAEILELPELLQGDGKAEMNVGCRRIDAQFYVERAAEPQLGQQFLLADDLRRPAAELRRVFSPAVLDSDDDLITYCTIGGRAATAWFVLTYLLGRDRVRVYDGSWAEWGCTPDAPVTRP